VDLFQCLESFFTSRRPAERKFIIFAIFLAKIRPVPRIPTNLEEKSEACANPDKTAQNLRFPSRQTRPGAEQAFWVTIRGPGDGDGGGGGDGDGEDAEGVVSQMRRCRGGGEDDVVGGEGP
jgi:hypothetical protein